ncbi:hypothetical protein TRV_03070 [Trichophyton verrucosum HKI 0517]|uniref:DUF1279 domain-containing protein n=1 Tax=Trichophyton verrucosum (strain HKI 0517) TaxID=663202 RepID=D4D7I8_TRIVH|nr:uncharacterized protein TRV_03070 [Trichophyton verrucosum HKI 0517]EFE42228.1 hypothetical protein TRV_03070 [Trichophyton verrucosum HKI 0517]
MRTLSREYGWAAVGVYFFLSALDFPFCFAAVRLLGVDRIGHYEHIIVGSVKDAIAKIWPGKERDARSRSEDENEIGIADDIEEAQKAVKGEASIWTQLALAYAIHKSFIFFRVPLTAAVTPKIVKTLRRWGWNIDLFPAKNPSVFILTFTPYLIDWIRQKSFKGMFTHSIYNSLVSKFIPNGDEASIGSIQASKNASKQTLSHKPSRMIKETTEVEKRGKQDITSYMKRGKQKKKEKPTTQSLPAKKQSKKRNQRGKEKEEKK